MTHEDKQLLLKDLCARLPYKPQIKFSIIGVEGYEVCELLPELITTMFLNGDADIKPFLRPMSSMTLTERQEYNEFLEDLTDYDNHLINTNFYKLQDWLNKHHFDYRRLIEKGLALEAPEGTYN